MSSKFENAIQELSKVYENRGMPNIGFGFSASDELISEIEKRLGVVFHEDYHQFLKLYGGIDIGDIYVFGTWSDSASDDRGTTVLGETLQLREEFSLPHYLIPFYKSGYDSYLCMNCSVVPSSHKLLYFSTSEHVVSQCDHSNSFQDFMESFVEQLKKIAVSEQR